MPDWNPKKVLKSHVQEAAKIWREDGYLKFKHSTRYDVIIGGEPYPPKAITGKTLYHEEFAGSKKGIWHRRLKELGFEIQTKRLGSTFSNEVFKSLKLSREARLKKFPRCSSSLRRNSKHKLRGTPEVPT